MRESSDGALVHHSIVTRLHLLAYNSEGHSRHPWESQFRVRCYRLFHTKVDGFAGLVSVQEDEGNTLKVFDSGFAIAGDLPKEPALISLLVICRTAVGRKRFNWR